MKTSDDSWWRRRFPPGLPRSPLSTCLLAGLCLLGYLQLLSAPERPAGEHGGRGQGSAPVLRRPQDAPRYALTDLGATREEDGLALGINEANIVVGRATTKEGMRAVIWQEDRMDSLATLGGKQSMAAAINRSGAIAGWASTATEATRAVRWIDSRIQVLPGLEDRSGRASDLNDAGEIAGSHFDRRTGVCRAFRWRQGAVEDLGGLDGESSGATAINERGQVVGWTGSARSSEHAFLWTDGKMTDIGTLGGASSVARDLNDRGEVVGEASTTNELPHAFLWRSGEMKDLGALGGETSEAYAISDDGQVVGRVRMRVGEHRAFLYTEVTGMVDLNRCVRAPGWVLTNALAINNRGVIVGYGTSAGRPRAFRLTPRPPPPLAAFGRRSIDTR